MISIYSTTAVLLPFRNFGVLACLLASLGIAIVPLSTTFAGVTAFNNQEEWEAALTSKGFSVRTETFDGLSIPSMTPTNGPHVIIPAENPFLLSLSITVLGQQRFADDAFIADGLFHGEIFPETGHTAYVHNFSQSVIAFGQNYTNPGSGRGIQLSSSEGVVDIFDDGGFSGFEDGFFGFIADEPISSVEVIGSDGPTAGEIYEALDVSFAQFPLVNPITNGDYNRDGEINAADYTIWRKTLGTTGLSPGFSADGNRDRSVTIADYEIWRSNFGESSFGNGVVSEAAAAIPEPAGAMLLVIALALCSYGRFKRQ